MRGPLRILVIEEDAGLRDLFKVLLEGYLAVVPETSREARRLLQQSCHDLLILDENDGTLERRWGIRRPVLGPTLLIAPNRRVRTLASDAPPLLVLPKPFAVEELLHFVETIHAARNSP